MGTTIRAELSKKNPYWLEKHRYYELKHFCQQYPIWKQAYNSLGGLSSRQADLAMCSNKYNMSNPTERIAIIRSFYSERMGMIEKTAKETDLSLAEYIVIGVTDLAVRIFTMNVTDVSFGCLIKLEVNLVIKEIAGCLAIGIRRASTSFASLSGFIKPFVVWIY